MKQIKTILIINAIMFIFFEPEKNLSLKKTLSLEKIWVLKNVFKSRKNLVFYKGKNYNENKTSNLK